MKRIIFVIGMLALMAGCGADKKSDSLNIQTNLKPVLNQSLPAVPVVTLNLKRADSTNIEGADLRLRIENGNYRVTAARGLTNVDGNLSLSLASGTYELEVNGVNEVADFTTSITVTASATQFINLQAERHSFAMDAGQAIDETDLKVYQAMSDGSSQRVFRDNNRTLGGAVNSNTVPVEMFPGSYFATAKAVMTAGGDTPLVKTGMLTSVAAATPTSTMDLSIAGIAIVITLQDAAGAPLQNHDILVYDKAVNIRLATETTDASGVATVVLGAATNTALLMEDNNGEVIGIKDLGTVSAAANPTYQLHAVSGVVLPPTGSVLNATDTATITVRLNSSLAASLDELANANISRNDIAMSPGSGVFTVQLLDGAYTFGAEGVEGFPSVTDATVTLATADIADQNIHVDLGGVIRGTLLNEASAPVTGLSVAVLSNNSLLDTNTRWIAGDVTDANGTYAIEVPYGTYDILVEGAITRDITVKAAANDKVVDLTRYAVSGRVTDATGAGLVADVEVLNGDATTSDALGVYTLNVVQGINQLCFTTDFGMACEFNVLFDDKTVASFRK